MTVLCIILYYYYTLYNTACIMGPRRVSAQSAEPENCTDRLSAFTPRCHQIQARITWTGSSPAWWLHGWLLQPAQVPTFSSSSHATEVGMALSCVLTREKVEQSSNRGTAYIVSIGIYSTREISSAPHRHPGAKPCAVLLCYYGIRDVCIMYYTVLK